MEADSTRPVTEDERRVVVRVRKIGWFRHRQWRQHLFGNYAVGDPTSAGLL